MRRVVALFRRSTHTAEATAAPWTRSGESAGGLGSAANTAEPGPTDAALAADAAAAAELAKVRAELSFIEERYQLMIAASDIGLWDMSVIGGDSVNPRNEFWWSSQFRAMLGYQDERDFPNVLGSWSARLHPDDSGWVLDAFASHLNDKSGRTPYDVEYRLQLKTGDYRWFRASGSTRRDRSGVPLRVAGSLVDINDQKNLTTTALSFVTRLGDSAEELATVSNEMSDTSRNAVEAAQSTARAIEKLGDSSSEIGKVVQFITTIADQTNLLALNATIEAARAGDTGRGFAVVANEVKALANETSRATGDIASKVEAIRQDTQDAVVAIQEIQRIVAAVENFQHTIGAVVDQQREAVAEGRALKLK
jgi:PAS domain S-box-containing protein